MLQHKQLVPGSFCGLTLLLLGCGQETSFLNVVIEADQEVAARSSRVLFEVLTQEGEVALSEQLELVETPFPIRRSVSPRGGDTSRVVTITARAINATGDTLTVARVIRSFVEGQTAEVRLRLYELCLGTTCPDGFTCLPIQGRAECLDAQTTPRECDVDNPESCPGLNYCNSANNQCAPGCDPRLNNQCGSDALCMGNQCVCITGYHECAEVCVSNSSVDSCGTDCTPCALTMNASQMGCDGTSCLVLSCASGFVPNAQRSACIATTATWSTPFSGETPPRRHRHTMAYDSQLNRVILFGGQGDHNNRLGDTWALTGNVWSQVATATGNLPRARHAMAYDSALNRMVLFGGTDFSTYNDTWVLNGNTWSRLNTTGTSPPAREGHAMVYDSQLQRVVLFGGYDGNNTRLNDTWVLNGSTWSQLATTGVSPPAREGHAMVYDNQLRRVVLFGGYDGSTLVATPASLPRGTWILSGDVWSQLQSEGVEPDARKDFAMVYDSQLNRIVLFGGWAANNFRSDTWGLSESSWFLLSNSSSFPAARYQHAMAYDGELNHAVLFGGLDESFSPLNDSWALR